MKKIFVGIIITMLLVTTGCGKNTESSVINDLEKKINKASAYKISGDLEIVNNDEVYNYDIEVSYKKDNNYKVILTNKANDHTQIILKNADGVYVLTPALNKSFKFQSDWPYSNSQIYLLKSLVNDIKNTKDIKFEEEKSGYKIVTTVNYPNNSKLVEQVIELNKKRDIKKVKVYENCQKNMGFPRKAKKSSLKKGRILQEKFIRLSADPTASGTDRCASGAWPPPGWAGSRRSPRRS